MEHDNIQPRRARARRSLFAVIALAGVAACSSQAPPAESEILGTAQQALNGYNYSDNRAWSQSPPSPITVANAPQFVQLGFDDNFVAGIGASPATGMTWILNFLRAKRNPVGNGNAATFDNALIRVNFYSNTCYIDGSCGSADSPTNIKESWHTAVADGHETGSHTHSHLHGGAFTAAEWNAQIDPNTDWLTRPYVANAAPGPSSGPGVSNAGLEGFRAPFLEFDTVLFSELKNNGFTYDVSIEEGWQLAADGLNYNWPFTLNNGSPSFTTGNVTGLWELGAAPFVRPGGAGRVTGLDYNMFAAGFTKQQALDTLKFTLDQRLAGNRAPFLIGAHTHIYSDAVSFAGTTSQERRAVIEEFITYALTKPQVRFATAKNIITWMRNPVALGGGCTAETNAQFCSRLNATCGSLTANDNCGTSRTVSSCGTCTSPATCQSNVCVTASPADLTEGGSASGTGTACNTTTETVAKAYDNLFTAGTQGTNWTKWCVASAPSTTTPISTMYDFSGTTSFAVNRYTITTGNDVPARDPKNWTFQGCQGTCTVGSDTGWTTINTQTNQFAGAARFQTNTYTFTNGTAFQQYRLRVTANNGDTGTFQFAEIQMFADGGCTAESNTAFCSRLGKNCGSVTANDNCGTSRTVTSCGTCTSPQTCGGGGTANVCGNGCTAESNTAFCSRLGKNCGSVTANDNCGTSRTVTSCGTCTSPQTCGGGGTANVCGGGGGSCSPTITMMSVAKCNDTFVFATDNKLYKCISQDVGVNGQTSPGCGTVGVRCSQIAPNDPAWGATAWQFVQTCP